MLLCEIVLVHLERQQIFEKHFV